MTLLTLTFSHFIETFTKMMWKVHISSTQYIIYFFHRQNGKRKRSHSIPRRSTLLWLLQMFLQKEMGIRQFMERYLSRVQEVQGKSLSIQAEKAGESRRLSDWLIKGASSASMPEVSRTRLLLPLKRWILRCCCANSVSFFLSRIEIS